MRRVASLSGPGLLAGAFVCTLAGLLGCTLTGDGQPGTETRSLPAFDAVEVFDDFAVTLEVDGRLAARGPIAAEFGGDANALDRLFAEVHAVDTLSLGVDIHDLTRLSLVPTMSARVPALRRIFAEDRSTLQVSGARGTLAIELHREASSTVQGGGPLAVEVVADEDAGLVLTGEGPSLTIVVSGRATIDAGTFVAEAVRVQHHGSGEVVVCATKTLVIRGSGAAKVRLDCA
ncbi:MAG: DUF2807 domain-containing protein [Nannocystis sp.]|nr:DUF2807 domain-containing protein [Nannocystis sp.]MBA3549014.1 DUF2807 domain-containing protein [Nannocystis sp.]